MSECPGRPALLQLIDTKVQDLRRRGLAAIAQLTDEDVNWRPNEDSNSAVNIVAHLAGNLHQNLEAAVAGRPDTRDRDSEFNTRETHTKDSISAVFDRIMTNAAEIISNVTPADLTRTVTVGTRETTVLAVLFMVATHTSEHVGQLLYLAKLKRGAEYQVLSVQHKRKG